MTTAAAKLVRWVRGAQPEQLTCQQASGAMGRGELTIVDVREDHERAQSRIIGSLHIPLGDMASHLNELSQEVPVAFMPWRQPQRGRGEMGARARRARRERRRRTARMAASGTAAQRRR